MSERGMMARSATGYTRISVGWSSDDSEVIVSKPSLTV
jgi:hypothetical protein